MSNFSCLYVYKCTSILKLKWLKLLQYIQFDLKCAIALRIHRCYKNVGIIVLCILAEGNFVCVMLAIYIKKLILVLTIHYYFIVLLFVHICLCLTVIYVKRIYFDSIETFMQEVNGLFSLFYLLLSWQNSFNLYIRIIYCCYLFFLSNCFI